MYSSYGVASRSYRYDFSLEKDRCRRGRGQENIEDVVGFWSPQTPENMGTRCVLICELVHSYARIEGVKCLFSGGGLFIIFQLPQYIVSYNEAVTILPFSTWICKTGSLLSKKTTYTLHCPCLFGNTRVSWVFCGQNTFWFHLPGFKMIYPGLINNDLIVKSLFDIDQVHLQ